jgi:trimeric autotransporter adhesin
MNSWSQLKWTTPVFVIALLLACFRLLPRAQAVVPAPDGGYPGGNTAEGQAALFSRTTGGFNAAVGFVSLRADTTGSFNTAIGAGTLLANNADENTATGVGALLSTTTGGFNTATGAFALFDNTEGTFNCAFGWQAMLSNINGGSNTAIGNSTLQNNLTGFSNTAIGGGALGGNITGSSNTALGVLAGASQTTGSGNVYIGGAISGLAGENNTTRIRNIGSTPIVGGITVVVESTGGEGGQRLGFLSSSRRYKEDIQPMDKASETLLALKPVTFQAKGDSTHLRHYGLIAEDVANVDPHLVVYNSEGRPETLRFDSINAMLLNEFLKEHREVAQLKSIVAEQRTDMEAMAAQLKEQSAQIQKVNRQLELNKSGSKQVVLNTP